MTRKLPAVLFDVDGTLVDVSSIRHYVMDGPFRNFDAFHRMSSWCPPIAWVLASAMDYDEQGYAILVVSAREDKWRQLTEQWLDNNWVPREGLWMRKTGDFRPDYEVKQDIYNEISQTYDIQVAFDDNPNVIRLWQDMAIPEIIRVPGWDGVQTTEEEVTL